MSTAGSSRSSRALDLERAAEHPIAAGLADEVRDDLRRMLFMGSRRPIPRESRLELALNTLCGFGIPEIAAPACDSAERLVHCRALVTRSRARDSTFGPIYLGKHLALVPPEGAPMSTNYVSIGSGVGERAPGLAVTGLESWSVHGEPRIELYTAVNSSLYLYFEPDPEGCRYTVIADVVLRGALRALNWLAPPIVRSRVQRFVLAPMQRSAESR